ncbi:MAG TPA: GNAT family N-acetyltransferase [Opitutus sp.]|nr:GNAT family N-acetyltransferase [Opitutus sp.]
MSVHIRSATPADVPLILSFIRALADYEKLTHEVEATEEKLHATLFGERPAAECILAFADTVETANTRDAATAAAPIPAGFAIFFTNYSTFLAKPGLYLEDLFVKPEFRGRGIGKALILHLARLANTRGCGRMEWTVLDWNAPAIAFYESLGAERKLAWQICRLTGPALEKFA